MPNPRRTVPDLYDAARSGERRALGRLLSVVERSGANADAVSELAHRDAGNAHIVGITGAPGSGKSTLVGQLVGDLVLAGSKPAVLSIRLHLSLAGRYLATEFEWTTLSSQVPNV